jgi:hypothetical protein
MRSSSGLIFQEVMRQSPGGTDPLVVSLTSINSRTVTIHGIQTGDVVKATIDENGVIIGYVNGVEVIRATDKTYPSGNPGIGFWLLAERREGRRSNADYGFSSFTATDGLPSPERK